jgi:hypothetical protein
LIQPVNSGANASASTISSNWETAPVHPLMRPPGRDADSLPHHQ